MTALPIILTLAAAYLGIGAVFGVVFVCAGVQRVDHAAAGSPWSFRLLILPGSVAFWPWLLRRWARGSGPPAPADPKRGRVERTRGVLIGAGACWGVVLLAWFAMVAFSRWGGLP
ncbi:MAG: hypothetical protein JNK58_11235 [Phycisphaerae bacterium]|nr:hypothetical protein [Phycisphaerae bacterium]